MFQFPGLALFRVMHLQCIRLSHSEIFGLTLVCSYPKLIAAYHVLHRLLVPRHPPYALIRFKYCVYFIVVISLTTVLLRLVVFKTYSLNCTVFVCTFVLTLITKKIAFPICQRTFSMCEY